MDAAEFIANVTSPFWWVSAALAGVASHLFTRYVPFVSVKLLGVYVPEVKETNFTARVESLIINKNGTIRRGNEGGLNEL